MNPLFATLIALGLLAAIYSIAAPGFRRALRRRRERNALLREAGFASASKLVDDLIATHGEDAVVTGPVYDAVGEARWRILALISDGPGRQAAYFDAVVRSFAAVDKTIAAADAPDRAPERLSDVRNRIADAALGEGA